LREEKTTFNLTSRNFATFVDILQFLVFATRFFEITQLRSASRNFATFASSR